LRSVPVALASTSGSRRIRRCRSVSASATAVSRPTKSTSARNMPGACTS
jgi:hypothetical protein